VKHISRSIPHENTKLTSKEFSLVLAFDYAKQLHYKDPRKKDLGSGFEKFSNSVCSVVKQNISNQEEMIPVEVQVRPCNSH
jgi:hypothetical protein